MFLTIFVPAYNEADNLTPLLEKLRSVILANKYRAKVLLVDDGSTDDTWREAKSLAQKYPFLKLLRHRQNLGLTQSFNSAITRAKGDVLVFLPADLQSDPTQDVPKLVKKLNEGYDLVAGQRQNRPFWPTLDSAIFNWLLRVLFGVPTHDANWIKAGRLEAFKSLHLKSNWHRLIIPLAKRRGCKIAEVSVDYFPRTRGESKFGWARVPGTLIDIIQIYLTK